MEMKIEELGKRVEELESKINKLSEHMLSAVDGTNKTFQTFADTFNELSDFVSSKLGDTVIKFKKLDPNAIIPNKANEFAAGIDINILEEYTLQPGEKELLRTGIACEIPEGFELQVRPRSGLSSKGLIILNSPGTVDSDYRGEVYVSMMNISENAYHFEKGERIAQLVLSRLQPVNIIEVEELSSTERGEKGFGSTGKCAMC